MPYAANGKIAADKFAGSIKITDDQYAEALEGMCNGLVVTINDGFKVAPPIMLEPPAPPEPTPEELAQATLAQRDRLLGIAAIRIAPLQDAVDLGDASGVDATNLKKWKQYRVALNRVDAQPGFPTTIDWPAPPA